MVVATVSHQLDSPPPRPLPLLSSVASKAPPGPPEPIDSFTAHLESRTLGRRAGVAAAAAAAAAAQEQQQQAPLPPPPSKGKLFGSRSNSSKEKLEGIPPPPLPSNASLSSLLPSRIAPRGTGASLSAGAGVVVVAPSSGPGAGAAGAEPGGPGRTHHSGAGASGPSSTGKGKGAGWLRQQSQPQPHPQPPHPNPAPGQSLPTAAAAAPCPTWSPPASVTCRSPSPPRLDSVDTAVGLGNASGGPTLSRKKSSASLLYRSVGRGLGRAASVMRRNNTAPEALGGGGPTASTSAGGGQPRSTEPGSSRHHPTGTWSSRRARRNPSVGLAELSEDTPALPVIANKMSESPSPPKEAPSRITRSGTLSRRRKSRIEPPPVPDAGVSRPFNVQLHVTADLDGLPQEWLQSLKVQGLSEADLLLITAAQRRQRAVALTPIRPITPGTTSRVASPPPVPPVVTVTASPAQVSFPDEPPRPKSQQRASVTSPNTPTYGESSGASASRRDSRSSAPPTRADSRRTRRHTFIDGNSLQRSSSIISKLLSDLDSISTRPSRPVTVVTDTLSPPLTGRPMSSGTLKTISDAEGSARSSIAESLHLLTRRLSDDLAGFRNIDVGAGEENWAASILAAWDVDKALSSVPERARTSVHVPPPVHVPDYVPQPSLSVEHEAEETESVSAAVQGATPVPSPLPTPLVKPAAVALAPMSRLYPEDSSDDADAADESEVAGTDTGFETTDDHASDDGDAEGDEPVHLRRRSRSFDWTVINRASTFTPLPPPPPRHVIRSPTPQSSVGHEPPRKITGLHLGSNKRKSVDSFGVLPSASAYSEQSRRSLDSHSPGTPSSELGPGSDNGGEGDESEAQDSSEVSSSNALHVRVEGAAPLGAVAREIEAFRPGHPFAPRSRSNTYETQESGHSTLSSEYFKRYPLQAQRIQPQPQAAASRSGSFPVSRSSSDHASFPVSAVSVPVSPTAESSASGHNGAAHPFFTAWNPTGFGASSLPKMSALGLCLTLEEPATPVVAPEAHDEPAGDALGDEARISVFSSATSSAYSLHEATVQRAWPGVLRRVNESLEHCRSGSESGSSNDAINALGALEEAAWRMSISQGR
ncbi:hypothetical protein Q8F55_005309 [Vanrija albida]|uniref:CRIB domain-containing protein n=1 Tax=Vanrija albida TaxID=181172 RepID=A0ABR3Q1R3_9TREE